MGDLRSAEASFRSPYGLIRSEWTTEQGGFDLLVEVPANTTARIYVPAPAGSRVCEAGSKSRSARMSKARYGGRVPRIRRWVGYLPLQRAIGDPVWKRGRTVQVRPSFCFAAAMPSGRSAESPQGSCIIPADFPQDARIPRKPLCRRCFPCRRCRWCFWCCRACAISPPPADFAGTGRFSGGQ